MARELRRLLIAPERLASQIALTREEERYLTRVLRFSAGDRFAVVNGQGALWTAVLRQSACAELEQSLEAPLEQQPAPAPQLVLAAAVVKRDFEVVLRMAVELGVDRFIPLLCERTVVQGSLRLERWRSIAAEAAEQCERLWSPRIEEPMDVHQLLGLRDSAVPGFWATTRQQELPLLASVLADLPLERLSSLWLACGPEGGWSPSEEQAAEAAGWKPVDLGPRILRSSTACVSGLSSLSSARVARCGS
ncbi:MAG: 16S rRNA (uracil(1498)-N(3))-methyltransferase [Vulcanococcus sp.]|uniref:16S rRNA (uracil(1498)-N(3))-methyltransferase n=1 Tax=Vulcanococcus sp. TaxID=2856995 RepID=UPI003C0283AF